MTLPMDIRIKQLLREAFTHRNKLVAGFVVISLSMLAVGVVWPKKYESYVTILVDNKNIIQPLMEGTAVPTGIADQARNARELLNSRNIMFRIMDFAGLTDSATTALERERLLEKFKRRMRVSIVGRDIIKISYEDADPERAQRVTQKLAEVLIEESRLKKTRESAAAYEFIDKQVREFHAALVESENRLKEFRSATLDAKPGTENAVVNKIAELQRTLEKTRVALREAVIKKQSLEKQLSGEAEVTVSLSREGQYQMKLAELQTKLDALRLRYHDTYPDIVSLKHQIENLKQAIVEEKKRRQEAKKARATGRRRYMDEAIVFNPLTEEIRSELSATKTLIATLKARISETEKLLQEELERGRRIHVSEATLAELTRDYQVNRDIYQDLLKRREKARISMNLDREQQGLKLSIYEPAFLPLKPTGIRFMHFALGGLLLGALAPLGLLYGLLQIDSRVRDTRVITEKLALPVVAVVPHLATPTERQAVSRNLRLLATVLFFNLIIYGTAGWLKYSGII